MGLLFWVLTKSNFYSKLHCRIQHPQRKGFNMSPLKLIQSSYTHNYNNGLVVVLKILLWIMLGSIVTAFAAAPIVANTTHLVFIQALGWSFACAAQLATIIVAFKVFWTISDDLGEEEALYSSDGYKAIGLYVGNTLIYGAIIGTVWAVLLSHTRASTHRETSRWVFVYKNLYRKRDGSRPSLL